jgi:hypothetical protein
MGDAEAAACGEQFGLDLSGCFSEGIVFPDANHRPASSLEAGGRRLVASAIAEQLV